MKQFSHCLHGVRRFFSLRRPICTVDGHSLGVLLAVGLFSLGLAPAKATPVIESSRAIQEANPKDESSGNWNLDWSYIYNFRKSSAVAVDPYWLLTAAHVADDYEFSGNLTINEITYTIQETRFYDGTSTGSTNKNDATRDLALIRFDNAFPGYYDIATGSSFVGEDVILVGYGYDGVVTQGPTSGSWTDTGSGSAKRWGTNYINSLSSFTDGYGTYNMFITTISGTNPSQNNTPYETGVNVRDSGGPMFALSEDEWVVVGINIARTGNPFNTTYSAPVGDYSSWILQTIPEPSIAILFILAGAAATIRRRVKQNRRGYETAA